MQLMINYFYLNIISLECLKYYSERPVKKMLKSSSKAYI